MKLIIKQFTNGTKITLEGGTKKDCERLEKAARKLKGCTEVIVTAFDNPLPNCAPGEQNC